MKIGTIMGILWILLLTVAMAWVGKEGYRSAVAYEESSRQMSEMMKAENLAKLRLRELADTLTFGLLGNELRERMERLRKIRTVQEREARRLATLFAGLSLAALGSFFFLSPRLYTAQLALASLVALINGLVTPILMIVVHKEVEYLGDVVLSFESKGILGSLYRLYEEGNLAVAGVILLFSVLLPLAKTLSLLFLSLFETRPFATRTVRFFKAIGKWSMLDVFVVALLLVYLGSGRGGVARSEIEIGLYFFLAYVFLSMAASLAAERMLGKLSSATASPQQTLMQNPG
jgi:hypothetical protein